MVDSDTELKAHALALWQNQPAWLKRPDEDYRLRVTRILSASPVEFFRAVSQQRTEDEFVPGFLFGFTVGQVTKHGGDAAAAWFLDAIRSEPEAYVEVLSSVHGDGVVAAGTKAAYEVVLERFRDPNGYPRAVDLFVRIPSWHRGDELERIFEVLVTHATELTEQARAALTERLLSYASRSAYLRGGTIDERLVALVDRDVLPEAARTQTVDALHTIAMHAPWLAAEIVAAAPNVISERCVAALRESHARDRQILALLEWLHEPPSDALVAAIAYRASMETDRDPVRELPEIFESCSVPRAFVDGASDRLVPAVQLLATARALANGPRRPYALHDASARLQGLWTAAHAVLVPVVRDYVDIAAADADELLAPLAIVAGEHDALRAELERVAESHGVSAIVRSSVRGLLLIVTGGHDEAVDRSEELLASIAAWMRFRALPPAPLEAASATWVTDARVERALRSAAEFAERDFVEEARRSPRPEEWMTPALVTHLAKAIARERLGLIGTGVDISADSVPISRAEEDTVGADLVIVVRAIARGWIDGEWASFVQAKKDRGRTKDPSWTLELVQLRRLLAVDESAVYWLFDRTAVVHVVPAKLLDAIVRARAKPGQKTLNVGFNSVRSAAIPLRQYLVDLTMGAWLGSRSDDALAIASGTDARLPVLHRLALDLQIGPDRDRDADPPRLQRTRRRR